MSEPVLVIHGVANRDRVAFNKQVEMLQTAVGRELKLIPVFWGHLGAEIHGITDTIPQIGGVEVRATRGAPPSEVGASLLRSIPTGPLVRSERSAVEIVSQAAAAVMAQSPSTVEVRAEDFTEPIRSAIQLHWSDTRWLKLLDNQAILEEIGGVLGLAAMRYAARTPDGISTRGVLDDLKEVVKAQLLELDEFAGMLLGSVLGTVNQYMRAELGPGIGRFLGDVFVYQRQRTVIQKCIWDTISQHAPGYGTEMQPICAIAHSLGGVIAFDAAVANEPPLWIKGFITFGSQSSFFHVLDPRGGGLHNYSPGQRVSLPPTVRAWTNLWEPMDPLAFLAGKVFLLQSGQSPEDIEVSHLASSGLWTHSSYWVHPALLMAIQKTLI